MTRDPNGSDEIWDAIGSFPELVPNTQHKFIPICRLWRSECWVVRTPKGWARIPKTNYLTNFVEASNAIIHHLPVGHDIFEVGPSTVGSGSVIIGA